MQPQLVTGTHTRLSHAAGPYSWTHLEGDLTLLSTGHTGGGEPGEGSRACILPVGFPFPGIRAQKESVFGAVSVQTPGGIQKQHFQVKTRPGILRVKLICIVAKSKPAVAPDLVPAACGATTAVVGAVPR